MRFVLVVCLALAGCAPSEELEVSKSRQAMNTPVPTAVAAGGAVGARLGTSVASCLNETLAGGPGANEVWARNAVRSLDGGVNFGQHVQCMVAGGVVVLFAGSSTGLFRNDGATNAWTLISSGQVAAMDWRPGGPLAVLFRSPSELRLFDDTGALVGTGLVTSPSSSVRWVSNALLLVGDEATGTVTPFSYASPAVTRGMPMTGPAGFGRSLAVGDFVPAKPGNEVVIGSPGTLWFYDATLTVPFMHLDGGASFGAALATQPSIISGLDALWIGEPQADTVYWALGSALEAFPGPTSGESYGQALSVTQLGMIYVGAPAASANLTSDGKVYALDQMVPLGNAADCATHGCPSVGCTQVCVGGVICREMYLNQCATGQACDVSGLCVVAGADAGQPATDAGAPDGGGADAGSAPDAGTLADAGSPVDAGEPVDAGTEPDAGSPLAAGPPLDAGPPPDAGALPDAGSGAGLVVDPGPFAFQARACSAAPVVPLVLAVLALTRRRRR